VILRIQTWCHKHWVPYIHGCVWDRECRFYDAPPRISLHWGRWMLWVDLPGYWMTLHWDDADRVVRRRGWCGPSFGYHRRSELPPVVRPVDLCDDTR